jgi:hypothetical protein
MVIIDYLYHTARPGRTGGRTHKCPSSAQNSVISQGGFANGHEGNGGTSGVGNSGHTCRFCQIAMLTQHLHACYINEGGSFSTLGTCSCIYMSLYGNNMSIYGNNLYIYGCNLSIYGSNHLSRSQDLRKPPVHQTC